MNKAARLVPLSLLALALPAAPRSLAQTAGASLPPDTVARLEALIKATMAEKNLPGAVVGVWIPGQGQYVAAFGTANLATGRPRQVTDPFRIASITKTFTATAILQLADQGRLSTADPISRWFPDFPNAARITVKDLLTMRGGIPEFADKSVLAAYYANPLAPFGAQDAIRVAAAKTAEFSPPNQQTVYTNTNYVLLEQIVEKASGQTMNAFLAANVFGPLGLTGTFYARGPVLPGQLRGYSWEAATNSFRDMTELNPQLAGGSGAVVSTLADLRTYVRALCMGTLLKPATQAQRLAGTTGNGGPASARYGEGVVLLGRFCGHNGTIFGFSSEAWYLPARDAVIVVNVNRLDADDQSQSTELFLGLTRALFPNEVSW